MKKPSGGTPKRTAHKRTPLRIIRVLTEGAVTEPHYLTLLARKYRHEVTVRHAKESSGSVPLTLVQRAQEELRTSRQRRKADGPDFDEIWCVFDTDVHPNLDRAIQAAAGSGIETAVSNPCFELWLVLHAEDRTAHIHRHDIQRRAESLGLTDGKSICEADAEELLLTNTAAAIDRARQLDSRHEANGSPAGENPSSGVWRLVQSIES